MTMIRLPYTREVFDAEVRFYQVFREASEELKGFADILDEAGLSEDTTHAMASECLNGVLAKVEKNIELARSIGKMICSE